MFYVTISPGLLLSTLSATRACSCSLKSTNATPRECFLADACPLLSSFNSFTYVQKSSKILKTEYILLKKNLWHVPNLLNFRILLWSSRNDCIYTHLLHFLLSHHLWHIIYDKSRPGYMELWRSQHLNLLFGQPNKKVHFFMKIK